MRPSQRLAEVPGPEYPSRLPHRSQSGSLRPRRPRAPRQSPWWSSSSPVGGPGIRYETWSRHYSLLFISHQLLCLMWKPLNIEFTYVFLLKIYLMIFQSLAFMCSWLTGLEGNLRDDRSRHDSVVPRHRRVIQFRGQQEHVAQERWARTYVISFRAPPFV